MEPSQSGRGFPSGSAGCLGVAVWLASPPLFPCRRRCWIGLHGPLCCSSGPECGRAGSSARPSSRCEPGRCRLLKSVYSGGCGSLLRRRQSLLFWKGSTDAYDARWPSKPNKPGPRMRPGRMGTGPSTRCWHAAHNVRLAYVGLLQVLSLSGTCNPCFAAWSMLNS